MAKDTISVNRAPVLTLWAAVVARRLGYAWEEALTLGKAIAGLNAQSKGRRLGVYEAPTPEERAERKAEQPRGTILVDIFGRAVPAKKTSEGVRALTDGKPANAGAVEKYLEGKFGDRYDDVRKAMEELAGSYKPEELAEAAYALYEQFRPTVPRGTRGWGAKGELDLKAIRSLER